MFNFRRRKLVTEQAMPVHSLVRLELATDKMNAAIRGLPENFKRVRPYTVTGSRINEGRLCVILGYWANARFHQTYSSDGFSEI